MERPLNTNTLAATALHDPPLPVRAKLAAAWTSFMFLYIYVDHLALYKPGVVDDILVGVVWEFAISQTLLTVFLTSVAIPIVMIVLSMTLRVRMARTLNLVVASLNIPFAMFNAVGESWTYFYGLSIALEVLLLAFILRSAWTWPRTASASMPDPVAPSRSQIQMGR
jgi:membrane-anchored protein YejM (alkaline phosphatase superfamily)